MARRADWSVGIVGTLRGAFWWPIGEPWEKEVTETRLHQRGERFQTYRSTTADLRDLACDVTNDGDSSGPTTLSPDSIVVVTKMDGSRTRQRVFPVTMFPSIADCIGK
jgi:hypothetical protein